MNSVYNWYAKQNAAGSQLSDDEKSKLVRGKDFQDSTNDPWCKWIDAAIYYGKYLQEVEENFSKGRFTQLLTGYVPELKMNRRKMRYEWP